jgi:starch phosphorylase
MTGTRFPLEVQPTIPEALARLTELANNLLYSWDRSVRRLFVRLDRELWESCGHSPKVFLRRVSQQRLEEASRDRLYMEDYARVLSVYDSYQRERMRDTVSEHLHPEKDLVAYFCAEFGLHESLPIYSGGLGILAGDHCKAASDLGLPFVAVGLMYRLGYFNQTIDGHGAQVAHYTPTHFADLPISPALDAKGAELIVTLSMPGRTLRVKVWQAKAGHIRLFLLDTDLPENSSTDRAITHQLYGGDVNTRIQQEIVLGIGGVRALRALGLAPSVWHINEGHSAFQILERCRERVAGGMDFAGALELIAAGTVFTTHTPVPAGHDIFDHQLMRHYFGEYVAGLGIGMDEFLLLGSSPAAQGGFNQTAFALRGSRFHNGVSRIHGSVASRMEHYIWPQIPAEENPISYVTNGVHVPTFLAREWVTLLDHRVGGEWRNEMLNPDYWECIDQIPDHSYWSLRQSLKSELLEDVRRRVSLQCRRNGLGQAQIDRVTRHLSPHETDVLTVGFARRFATYKRATLLFQDPQRLARIVNNPERPIVLLFAGKAHPNDLPGQHLIQTIHEYSRRPEFEGRILMIEGYDLALARKLVTGVDVWLNTPEYPKEASGTSGEKAGINGVLNLSVKDGWWGEGYNGENGWAINPHTEYYDSEYSNREESNDLLTLLERQVAPLYYERNGHGYSSGWVRMSKCAMKSLLPQFNAQRMVMDYITRFYGPASRHRRRMLERECAPARELSAWKSQVHRAWPKVKLRRTDTPLSELHAGEHLTIEVAAELHGLKPDDVVVECLVCTEEEHGACVTHDRLPFESVGVNPQGETLYRLDLLPSLAGLQYYQICMYPFHELLRHPFELGCMIWL